MTKYVQGMQAEGIPVTTMTIQNEPLNEKNTPSMLMLGEEQDVFIRENLGPAFRKAGIKTGIVLYDHNLDHPLYVLDILRDKAAAQYVDGSGWHLYGGQVEAMTQVHDEFPNKNIYFTEQSTTERNGTTTPIAVPVARVMIAVSRNWSRNILLWNLACRRREWAAYGQRRVHGLPWSPDNRRQHCDQVASVLHAGSDV